MLKMPLLLNCQTLKKSGKAAQTLQKRCWALACHMLPCVAVTVPILYHTLTLNIKMLPLRHSKSDAGSGRLSEWFTDQGGRRRLL